MLLTSPLNSLLLIPETGGTGVVEAQDRTNKCQHQRSCTGTERDHCRGGGLLIYKFS